MKISLVFVSLWGLISLCLSLGLFYLANQAPNTLKALPVIDAPTWLTYGLWQGLLVGSAFLCTVLLINRLPRHRWLAASIALVIFTPLAIGGFWFSTSNLGISDWDYYFSYHEVLRQGILVHHTFPFWNPYICGGTAGLGDPEFPVFTPTFLLELIFGIPIGFRLAIMFSTAMTALGMLMLGKRLKLSVNASLLAALVVAFGSVNLLEIVEGHPNIFSAMWVPWIFWAWLAEYKSFRLKHSILTGTFLALTFFQGGIYMLMYVTITLGLLIIFLPKHKRSFLITATAGLWALGFAAIKLIPVLFWLNQFQDQVYASSANTLLSLHKILLGRFLHGETNANLISSQGSGWHEYGAYIGPIAFALAFVRLSRLKTHRLTQLLIAFALIFLLFSALGPTLKPFFNQVSYFPRSNISRIILFAVLPLALLAGQGLDQFSKRFKYLGAAIVGLAAIDLFSLAYPLSLQAFTLVPAVPTPETAAYPLERTVGTFMVRSNGVDYTRAYTAIKSGYGTETYCSVLTPTNSTTAIEEGESDQDRAYVTLSNSNDGTTQLLDWNYNRVAVSVNSSQPTQVILNSNYASGWLTNGKPAKEINNRLGASIPKGHSEIIFTYRSPGFIAGLVVTLLSLIAALTSYIFSTTKYFNSGHASIPDKDSVLPSR